MIVINASTLGTILSIWQVLSEVQNMCPVLWQLCQQFWFHQSHRCVLPPSSRRACSQTGRQCNCCRTDEGMFALLHDGKLYCLFWISSEMSWPYEVNIISLRNYNKWPVMFYWSTRMLSNHRSTLSWHIHFFEAHTCHNITPVIMLVHIVGNSAPNERMYD